jgi:hypothetical protein
MKQNRSFALLIFTIVLAIGASVSVSRAMKREILAPKPGR